MPTDFHIAHVRMCIRRSQQRYLRLYGRNREISPETLLREELAHYPCGRKSWLYMLVRATGAVNIVETGVWFGFSTSQILQAIADNGKGKLTSIDAPNIRYRLGKGWHAEQLPRDEQTGFVIPDKLRTRWQLVPGFSRDVLTAALQKAGQIDLFYHDSEHTYENMMFKFREAWKYLVDDGVICADDVDDNDAFDHFCAEVSCQGVVVNGIGIMVKHEGKSGAALSVLPVSTLKENDESKIKV